MNINKINPEEMTADEMEFVNKTIHEFRGLCWHKRHWTRLSGGLISGQLMKCSKCGIEVYISLTGKQLPETPDYCADLNVLQDAEIFLYETLGYVVFDGMDGYCGKFGWSILASSKVRAVALAKTIIEGRG